MNPWTIIGWILLGCLGLVTLIFVGAVVLHNLAHMQLHRATRNDRPEPGDVWIQGRSELRIKQVFHDGVVSMEVSLPGGSRASFSDTAEEWKNRVKNRKLWRSTP